MFLHIYNLGYAVLFGLLFAVRRVVAVLVGSKLA
jgi:hypothetical protein